MKWFIILAFLCLPGCEGCTDKPMQRPFLFPTYVLPPNGPSNLHIYTVTCHIIRNAEIINIDISPAWDLGRVGLKTGKDDVLHIARTTSSPDVDENGEAIADTMKDRKVEHVWITIPVNTKKDQVLKAQSLEEDFLTAFEVDNLDGKGRLNSTALLKGWIRKRIESDASTVFDFGLDVRPNRPFNGKDWEVRGEMEASIQSRDDYPADSDSNSSEDQ